MISVADMFAKSFTEIIASSIRYQTDGKSVEVLSIVHSARLLDEGTID
jgi:hypothetical protein